MTTSTRVRGDRVSELRDRYELSQSAVSHIETGRKKPSIDVALKMAAALDTSVEVLFGGDESLPTH